MRIFVISLKNATQRREATKAQFEKANTAFEFFDAIKGDDHVADHFSGINEPLYWLHSLREPLLNEIGCYASHLAMWKKCIELDEPILILEDDFELADEFKHSLSLIHEVTERFGFVRLENFRLRRAPLKKLRRAAHQIATYDSSAVFYLSDVPLCLTAYAIAPQAAKPLIEASRVVIAPVDKFVQKTWLHGAPIFALEPVLVNKSSLAEDSMIGVRQKKSKNPWLHIRRFIYKTVGEFQRLAFDNRQMKILSSDDSDTRAPVSGKGA